MKKLFSKQPASWHKNLWREAFPSGNGLTGISVLGSINKETILLNRGDLWAGVIRNELPDVSENLMAMRHLASSGEYEKANTVLSGSLYNKGYFSQVGTPFPLADLNIEMPIFNIFSEYERSLDLESGEIIVTWKDKNIIYSRKCFVSREEDIIVVKLSSSNNKVSACFSLMKRNEDDSQFPCNEKIKNTIKSRYEPNKIFYSGVNDDGLYFGANCYLRFDGKSDFSSDKIKIKDSTEIVLYIKLYANSKKELTFNLENFSSYDDLLEDHKQTHMKLFNSVQLELYKGVNHANEVLLYDSYCDNFSNEIYQKLWEFGRYLLISASNEKGLPCSLYGLWHGDYNAQWSQNVMNENIEIILQQSCKGGIELALIPLFNYMDSLYEDFKENAKKVFGCNGILVHGYTCPNLGKISVNVPVITNWISGAGWIAHLYFDYYKFTNNEQFLKEKCYPFLLDVYKFYKDFLYLNSQGKFEFYPSVSPENSPGNFVNGETDTLSHPMPTAKNATMDIAIAKEIIVNLISVSKVVGSSESLVSQWKDALKKLPDYEINKNGVFKEWLHSDFTENYHHRHMAHLYPLFPGYEFTETNEFFASCEKALKKRLEIGLQDQSGWSMAHLSNMYARLKDGNKALECLNILIKGNLLKSFFTLHNDYRSMGMSINSGVIAPFQIDANMGICSAINEMLLFCNDEMLDILPALPKAWKNGKVKGLRFFSGSLDIDWNRKTKELIVKIYYKNDKKYKIKTPKEFINLKIIENKY